VCGNLPVLKLRQTSNEGFELIEPFGGKQRGLGSIGLENLSVSQKKKPYFEIWSCNSLSSHNHRHRKATIGDRTTSGSNVPHATNHCHYPAPLSHNHCPHTDTAQQSQRQKRNCLWKECTTSANPHLCLAPLPHMRRCVTPCKNHNQRWNYL